MRYQNIENEIHLINGLISSARSAVFYSHEQYTLTSMSRDHKSLHNARESMRFALDKLKEAAKEMKELLQDDSSIL